MGRETEFRTCRYREFQPVIVDGKKKTSEIEKFYKEIVYSFPFIEDENVDAHLIVLGVAQLNNDNFVKLA